MTGRIEPVADDGSVPGRGRVVGLGLALLAVSALTIVFVPIAVAAVAAWWVAEDARTAEDAPGVFGKIALALLALGWSLTAVLVLSADAHFDCGGTLGGFGEAASARLDDECVSGRSWRTSIGVVSVFGGTGVAGWLIRRWSHRRPVGEGRAAVVVPAMIVAGCAAVWTTMLALLVVS